MSTIESKMEVGGGLQMKMEASIHRLQRRAQPGEVLAPGEFLEPIFCSMAEQGCPQKDCGHPQIMGVYKAIPLGVIHGGSPLEKVESYLRIKFANLIKWLTY